MIMNQMANGVSRTNGSNSTYTNPHASLTGTTSNSFCIVKTAGIYSTGVINRDAVLNVIRLSDTERMYVSLYNNSTYFSKYVWNDDDYTVTLSYQTAIIGTTVWGYDFFQNGAYIAIAYLPTNSVTRCDVRVINMTDGSIVGSSSRAVGGTEQGSRVFTRINETQFWLGPSSTDSTHNIYTISSDGSVSYSSTTTTYNYSTFTSMYYSSVMSLGHTVATPVPIPGYTNRFIKIEPTLSITDNITDIVAYTICLGTYGTTNLISTTQYTIEYAGYAAYDYDVLVMRYTTTTWYMFIVFRHRDGTCTVDRVTISSSNVITMSNITDTLIIASTSGLTSSSWGFTQDNYIYYYSPDDELTYIIDVLNGAVVDTMPEGNCWVDKLLGPGIVRVAYHTKGQNHHICLGYDAYMITEVSSSYNYADALSDGTLGFALTGGTFPDKVDVMVLN